MMEGTRQTQVPWANGTMPDTELPAKAPWILLLANSIKAAPSEVCTQYVQKLSRVFYQAGADHCLWFTCLSQNILTFSATSELGIRSNRAS